MVVVMMVVVVVVFVIVSAKKRIRETDSVGERREGNGGARLKNKEPRSKSR